MLKGGGGSGTKGFEIVLTRQLGSFNHSDGGGGGQIVLPCLEGGGGRKKFWTRNFPIL